MTLSLLLICIHCICILCFVFAPWLCNMLYSYTVCFMLQEYCINNINWVKTSSYKICVHKTSKIHLNYYRFLLFSVVKVPELRHVALYNIDITCNVKAKDTFTYHIQDQVDDNINVNTTGNIDLFHQKVQPVNYFSKVILHSSMALIQRRCHLLAWLVN